MWRLLKVLGIGLLGLIILLALAGWWAHEPLPQATERGEAADALARKVEMAVNKPAWDSTRYVAWTFRPGTTYQWDKAEKRVIVRWGDYEVLLHTPTQQGQVRKAGELLVAGPERKSMLEKAWARFANDSFWLCAPMKVFDPGTKRGIVTLDDGSQGLLITYTSGGVTPGDHYLWILDEKGLPQAWKMWVNIIPVGGLKFTWTDWTSTDGPRLAQNHSSSLFDVPIMDLEFPNYTAANNPFLSWEAE